MSSYRRPQQQRGATACRDDTVVLVMRIEKLLYPKTFADYDGWGVFKGRIHNTHTLLNGQTLKAPSSYVTIKGSLPIGIAPYVQYRLECVKGVGKGGQGEVYNIRTVLSYRKDTWLSHAMVQWSLKEELGLDVSTARTVLRQLPYRTDKKNNRYLDHPNLTDTQRTQLSRLAFFNQTHAQQEALVTLLPGNLEELRVLTSASAAALLSHAQRARWEFALDSTLARYGLTTPVPLDVLLRGGNLALTDTAAKALALYEKIRHYADAHCHTYIHVAQLSYFLGKSLYPVTVCPLDHAANAPLDPDRMQVLLEWLVTHKAVIAMDIDGMPGFTFLCHYESWARTTQSIGAIRTRAASGGYTPSLEDALQSLRSFGDDVLDAEQRAVLQHVASTPFTFTPAPPGCGKTHLLCTIQECIGPSNFAVFTQNNCMVDELSSRGIEHAFTLQHYIYHIRHAATNKRSQKIVDELLYYPVVAVDELSNVDLATISYFYQHCCRNAVRVVHTYDPDQVAPITAGAPCIDIPLAMPDNVLPLHQNHRVLSGASGIGSGSGSASASGSAAAIPSLMLANDARIIKGQGYKMEFDQIVPHTPFAPPMPLSDCFLVTPSSSSSSSGNAGHRSGARDLRWILQNMIDKDPISGKIDLRRVQCISLHNDTCEAANAVVTAFHEEQEGFERKRNNQRPLLTPGMRFSVVGATFARQQLWPPGASSSFSSSSSSSFGSITSRSGGGGDAMEVDRDDDDDGNDAPIFSDRVSNRGKYVFSHYHVLNLKTGTWSRKTGRVLHRVVKKSSIDKDTVHVVFTQCGKQFAINYSRCASTQHLVPAWCITVDSYQGSQNDTIISLLPSAGIFTTKAKHESTTESMQQQQSPFGRNHLHVKFSRARKRLIVLGTKEEVTFLSMRMPPHRQTLLSYVLQHDLPASQLVADIVHTHPTSQMQHSPPTGTSIIGSPVHLPTTSKSDMMHTDNDVDLAIDHSTLSEAEVC